MLIIKAVLLSIKNTHLIETEEQKLIIQKSEPKIFAPFKVYMYRTIPKNGDIGPKDGKVIGEFICDDIIDLHDHNDGFVAITYRDLTECCMNYQEIKKYANGRHVFAWHISNLLLYDKPKELGEFYKLCPDYNNNPLNCKSCENVETIENSSPYCITEGKKYIKKAPQRWCYVEELR